MWWLFLLLPIFPTQEIAITHSFEVIYPAKGKVLSYSFQHELSPFVVITSNTTREGLHLYMFHVSLSNIIIPPLRLSVVENATTNTLLFDSWTLRVAPTNISLSNLHPIAPIYPFHNWGWIVWILLLLILVLAGFFLWKRAHPSPQPPEKQHPEETLHLSLEKLKSLIDTLEEKAYYSEVAYLLRRILEEAYGLPAREMGSLEIEHQLPPQQELKEIITDLLKWCDRVKYAKHITTREKREQVYTQLEEIYHILISPAEEEKQ